MEKAYWLSRKRASLKLAQDATSSQARLVHYDLAGRYSVKAISAETQATDLASAVPRSVFPACSGPDDECADHAGGRTHFGRLFGNLAGPRNCCWNRSVRPPAATTAEW